MPFFCIHISQGSVATCLKRGGIFKHEFVANLLPSRLVKKFENRIIVGEVMAKSLVSCFLNNGVHYRSLQWSTHIASELQLSRNHGLYGTIEPILIKLETYNYHPGTTHHAKRQFDPTTCVVSPNSQFATVTFLFVFLVRSSLPQVAHVDRLWWSMRLTRQSAQECAFWRFR